MGSGMYDMYPSGWSGCTCGPYLSVIPPEPCPIHDPERAYWRMRILREFGYDQYGTTTNTTTITGRTPGKPEPQFDIPKYESPRVEEPLVHYNNGPFGGRDKLACGANVKPDDVRWARRLEWVTCEKCERATQL